MSAKRAVLKHGATQNLLKLRKCCTLKNEKGRLVAAPYVFLRTVDCWLLALRLEGLPLFFHPRGEDTSEACVQKLVGLGAEEVPNRELKNGHPSFRTESSE